MTPRSNRLGEQTRRAIVRFILDFRAEYEVSPSVREIAAGVGKSLDTTHTHIQLLVRSGHLRIAQVPGLNGTKRDTSRCLLPTNISRQLYLTTQESTP